MSSRRRALRGTTYVPRWLVSEIRLWGAAVSGTLAARRRRRAAEAETVLLVPVSPHVGRPGARHAAPQREFNLKALQRRAVTSFGILLLAAVVGGLTGVLLVADGGRVGPQVVPADSGVPPLPPPSSRPTATHHGEPVEASPPGRDGRGPGALPTTGPRVAEPGRTGPAAAPVPDGTVSPPPVTASPTQRPGSTPRPTTSSPTPTPTDTPTTDPSTPAGDPTVVGSETTSTPPPTLG